MGPVTRGNSAAEVDDTGPLASDLVQLARLGLAGREQDIETFIRRLARRYRASNEHVAQGLTELLRSRPSRQSPLRNAQAGLVEPAPVDMDSRLDLVRHEVVQMLPVEPIWEPQVESAITQLVAERRAPEALEAAGLNPTRTVLLTGPPGVGKTLTARWLAHELDVPLLILDLAAVMSSFLGRTGSNLRKVLDYAKRHPCVLLVDELDAIAKRRDDASDVGELKRLVTVLLQEVDDWPASGLLLGATNHAELLDPAVWRRFEMVVRYPLPSAPALEAAIVAFAGEGQGKVPDDILSALTACLQGVSFNDVERLILAARRAAALNGQSLESELLAIILTRTASMKFSERRDTVAALVAAGRLSQRRASDLFNISRDAIRKATP